MAKDMSAAVAPETIYLQDYRPFPYDIESVALTFKLAPSATRVLSTLHIAPKADRLGEPLRLDGEGLKLISATLNGAPISPTVTDTALFLDAPLEPFVLALEVEIAPNQNTALEGLYMSPLAINGGEDPGQEAPKPTSAMYCTQCEAEGFRKITYYPDRPDVMAPFTVRIEGDMPVLLSNGNLVAQGKGWAEWSDPWPKPAYLFALVAGDLRATTDSFTTMEGKTVALNIYVRPGGDEAKTAYAMDALKRSMLWDEEVYGRPYDLDIFNIVAVDDFNMGAMENKGLNIFNSSCVLASPETATDADFARIEAIVAHEYFHNWTGNRITCRDWFQLCLKEGLTVYRDQQFSGDMRSHAVQRIKDVLMLRGRQFREDAGPLAHNVRPESFVEINNFYTATVYEKGAELIGMLRLLVGPDAYDKALTLYFDRHDGQACTIEDWLKAFEDATGRDLSQFKLWYEQAGTPRLQVSRTTTQDGIKLTFRQVLPDTPNQPSSEKKPQLIPITYGILSASGEELVPSTTYELSTFEGEVTHTVPHNAIVSMLRNFSAPVVLEMAQSDADRLCLMAFDTDPFNRWEAARSLAKAHLLAAITGAPSDPQPWLAALEMLLKEAHLEPAFKALCLALPSEDDLSQSLADAGHTPDPLAIYDARAALMQQMGQTLKAPLVAALKTEISQSYSAEEAQSGPRALKNAALRLLSKEAPQLAQEAYDKAQNMTDQLAAFSCLLAAEDPDVVNRFGAQWVEDRLVMDKWFMLQVAEAKPSKAVETARRLTLHPAFDASNPNRFRAVIGGLTNGNPAGFHDPSGAGYSFVANWLMLLDEKNPQTAARMSTAFETWKRFDKDRQALMRGCLERMAAKQGISRDLSEMCQRMLNA